VPQLKSFGHYLSIARQQAGFRTQQNILTALQAMGIKVSQGLLAKYETGKIDNPSPEVLKGIATLCNLSYENLISKLVQEKYGVSLLPSPGTLSPNASSADTLRLTIEGNPSAIYSILQQLPKGE
jgi:transcriptional regulator with XRE-family HTH domain